MNKNWRKYSGVDLNYRTRIKGPTIFMINLIHGALLYYIEFLFWPLKEAIST